LIRDEGVEVCVGEHAAWTFFATADDDIADIASGDVGVECLHGATELARGLGGRAKTIGQNLAPLGRLGRLGQAREILEPFLAQLLEELGERTLFATEDTAVDLEAVIFRGLGHVRRLQRRSSI
jgi:hypothetical protein